MPEQVIYDRIVNRPSNRVYWPTIRKCLANAQLAYLLRGRLQLDQAYAKYCLYHTNQDWRENVKKRTAPCEVPNFQSIKSCFKSADFLQAKTSNRENDSES